LHALCLSAERPGQTSRWRRYFWFTGVLSSFLDNAPTYLVFFNLAGGDPVALMGPMATTLAAISAGAVFMGAMTYIGNAPNFMVKSIAKSRGVTMPGFLGYMAWSSLILFTDLCRADPRLLPLAGTRDGRAICRALPELREVFPLCVRQAPAESRRALRRSRRDNRRPGTNR
jgi:hypothetical protein